MVSETSGILAAVQHRVVMSICKFQSSSGIAVEGAEPLHARKLPVGREGRKGRWVIKNQVKKIKEL